MSTTLRTTPSIPVVQSTVWCDAKIAPFTIMVLNLILLRLHFIDDVQHHLFEI